MSEQSFSKPDTDLAEKKEDDPKANPTQGLEKVIPDVKLETASTPYELKPTEAEAKSGKFVKYKGPALVRIMDASAWSAAGVESEDYFEWNYLNHKQIPMEAFSDAQLQYLLRVDGRFELVEVKAETTE